MGSGDASYSSFGVRNSIVYLDRIGARRPTLGDGGASGGTELADRLRPAVIDDPAARGRGGRGAVAYPYRRDRADRTADRVVPGGCNICFNTCSTNYHLRDGRLVRVTGNESDPLSGGRICPKSQLLVRLHNNDQRLTRPLKRVGERGEGRFEPVSWAQALDEIAAKLEAVRDRHGPEALGIFAGTRTGILAKKGYIALFAQMWGTPNVGDTEPFCSASKNLAFRLVQGRAGGGNSYTEADIGSAELYLYIGDNQAETRPVHFGMVNDWRIRHGARMVVVDPRLTVTASRADQWLPIRSGTDLALALAIAHHIFERGLEHRRFCEAWVLGWREWREFLAAKGYTPEWAAPITGIDAPAIRALAEDIATADGCVIFASRGVNQHANGTQTNRAPMFVAAITGNWGRRGGAYFNMSTSPPIHVEAPPERRAAIARPSIRHNPAGWLQAMTDGAPYPLQVVITCNNPLTRWPGQERVREAFRALDLLVHIDLFRNETSAFADYVLPVATGIEKGEIGRANEDRRIVWIDRAIEPPGEARPDGWIWIELGKRFGFDDVLRDDYKDSARFWDEMCIGHPELRGCTQRRLHSVPWRWVRFPLASEDAEEQETLYLDGSTAAGCPPGQRFPTPSGRLEFHTPRQEEQFARLGLSCLPEFYADREQLVDLPRAELLEPDDAPGVVSPFFAAEVGASPARIVTGRAGAGAEAARADGFDTELVTGRPAAPHFHSWTHQAWQAQEMWPDLYVQIHPDKARSCGIRDGARVRVETRHGAIEARAWIHAGIRPTAVFIPIGWGERQRFNPWRSVNFLTVPEQRDPLSDTSNLKTWLCRITAL